MEPTFTYEAFDEMPARNVYDDVARQFSESGNLVWKMNFTGTTPKADQGGLRRAVKKLGQDIAVVTLKGVLYLERLEP